LFQVAYFGWDYCRFAVQVKQKEIFYGWHCNMGKGRVRKEKRTTLYKKRHVLFQVSYFGLDFCGIAVKVKL
jgi:hypothetical protein